MVIACEAVMVPGSWFKNSLKGSVAGRARPANGLCTEGGGGNSYPSLDHDNPASSSSRSRRAVTRLKMTFAEDSCGFVARDFFSGDRADNACMMVELPPGRLYAFGRGCAGGFGITGV
jgi:hypothetical protein